MSQLISLILLFVPFFAIFLVANVAERRRAQGEPHQTAALVAYLLMGLIYVAGRNCGRRLAESCSPLAWSQCR